MTNTTTRKLTGLGAALLLAAFLAPAMAADNGPHPCREPWAAAGNNGGKADRHHVGRQAVKHCSADKPYQAAANVPQPQDQKPAVAER